MDGVESRLKDCLQQSKIHLTSTYSKYPKSGRPDFEFLETCPVSKTSGFQIIVWKPDITSGFRAVRSIHFIWTGRPVIGRLLYLKRLKTGYNVLFSDVRRFGTKTGTKTGSKPVLVPVRTKTGTKTGSKPVWNRFGTGHSKSGRCKVNGPEDPITGRYVRLSDDNPITGRFINRTILELSENRTSGFRTSTVPILIENGSILIPNSPNLIQNCHILIKKGQI